MRQQSLMHVTADGKYGLSTLCCVLDSPCLLAAGTSTKVSAGLSCVHVLNCIIDLKSGRPVVQVLMATNRINILDTALLRPGRILTCLPRCVDVQDCFINIKHVCPIVQVLMATNRIDILDSALLRPGPIQHVCPVVLMYRIA
jgi:SpoVK/Ycf46/Vps4 family AAA+-type ATPase